MSTKTVEAHRRRVAAARRRGELPPKFNPKTDCRSCFMIACAPCLRLNGEHGYELAVQHCDEHCPNERLRKKLSIVQGVDNRHLMRG